MQSFPMRVASARCNVVAGTTHAKASTTTSARFAAPRRALQRAACLLAGSSRHVTGSCSLLLANRRSGGSRGSASCGRARRSAAAGRPVAMVNVELSPATYLGVVLIGSGLTLLQIRQAKPLLSRDTDIISACVSILAGGILIFQGWRLDPILLFEQLLMASTAIAFGYEALRLRSELPDQQQQQQQQQQQRPPLAEDMLQRAQRGLPPPSRSEFEAWPGVQQQQQAQQVQWGGGSPGQYGRPAPPPPPPTRQAPWVDGQVGPIREAMYEGLYEEDGAAYGSTNGGASSSGRQQQQQQPYYGDPQQQPYYNADMGQQPYYGAGDPQQQPYYRVNSEEGVSQQPYVDSGGGGGYGAGGQQVQPPSAATSVEFIDFGVPGYGTSPGYGSSTAQGYGDPAQGGVSGTPLGGGDGSGVPPPPGGERGGRQQQQQQQPGGGGEPRRFRGNDEMGVEDWE